MFTDKNAHTHIYMCVCLGVCVSLSVCVSVPYLYYVNTKTKQIFPSSNNKKHSHVVIVLESRNTVLRKSCIFTKSNSHSTMTSAVAVVVEEVVAMSVAVSVMEVMAPKHNGKPYLKHGIRPDPQTFKSVFNLLQFND